MRKSKLTAVFVVTAALAVGVFSMTVPSLAKDDAPASWSLIYGDQSGNGLSVWKRAGDSKALYDYSPIRPEESSSGQYSGGEAKSGSLSDKDAAELWRRVLRLEADKSNRSQDRAMGTGAFSLRDTDGSRDFIVQQGATLKSFDDFADKLVATATNEDIKDGKLPVYPIAVKDAAHSGATSLPTGKNFTLSQYTADAPVAGVARFYEARLKGSRRIDNANGSVVFKSDAGNVTLFKSGEGTKIMMTQGPQ
ncbi:MAG TPA: hypothetical protein VFX30_00285 [bacterium]|nr:hypothetical protein [bacterium]